MRISFSMDDVSIKKIINIKKRPALNIYSMIEILHNSIKQI